MIHNLAVIISALVVAFLFFVVCAVIEGRANDLEGYMRTRGLSHFGLPFVALNILAIVLGLFRSL